MNRYYLNVPFDGDIEATDLDDGEWYDYDGNPIPAPKAPTVEVERYTYDCEHGEVLRRPAQPMKG